MDIDLSTLQLKKLSDNNTSLTKSFYCSDNDLNEFLKEDALKHQKEKITATYLCFYAGKVIGYFTWLTDVIELKGKDKRVFRKMGVAYRSYPAIKLARLAVDKNYAKSGVGSYLVDCILEEISSFSEHIGCRYITVDAYPGAYNFYKKLGFKVHTEKEHTVLMYYDIMQFIR